jgi:hypothetical protein
MVSADIRYVLWRAAGTPDCDARKMYRQVAEEDHDLHRRLQARAILGFSGPECGYSGLSDLKKAATLAKQTGLVMEHELLQRISSGELNPSLENVEIETSLPVPPDATKLILGETTIELVNGLRVGTQVERVVRDWLSYQMKWDFTGHPVAGSSVLNYHEGAFVKSIMNIAPVEIYPLAGTLIVRIEDKWYAADETGTFRFQVLGDKLQYPTTHVTDSFGWIVDTHGISGLVSQALQRQTQLVVGCGDSEGKMKAAFYLAEKGVNVVFPGDHYLDLVLGYEAKGILLGTAPVKISDGKAVIGGQPLRFLLREPIVVQDTKVLSSLQYYNTAARYFRRLTQFVPMNVHYVDVVRQNQIEKILRAATQLRSTVVAVRIMTNYEYEILRQWLLKSANHRAILFHSSLYPYAQRLFEQFPQQVTFGDPHPRFE